MNSLPAGGTVGVGEIKVSPVTLYTKQGSDHKCCFIIHYMPDEMKMTSNMFWRQSVSFRNTAPGFYFETCSAQSSILPTPQPFRIYFNDILMDRFVISQTPENNAVVHVRCSSRKGNYAQFSTMFYAQTYTLTKLKKVKIDTSQLSAQTH